MWAAIDVLEAQEHIALVRAVTYPKLTKTAQRERDKKLYASAYPRDIYKRETKSINFLAQKLGGK